MSNLGARHREELLQRETQAWLCPPNHDLPQLSQDGTPKHSSNEVKPVVFFSSSGLSPPTIIFSTFPAAYPLALLHSTMLTTEMCSKCSPECVHHNLNSLLLQSSTQLTSSYITNLSLRHSRPHFLCPSNGIFSVPEKITAMLREEKLVDFWVP